jgi:hypothetical protein
MQLLDWANFFMDDSGFFEMSKVKPDPRASAIIIPHLNTPTFLWITPNLNFSNPSLTAVPFPCKPDFAPLRAVFWFNASS